MKMKMALASVSGAFEGKVRITDQTPPSSFRLAVEGAGKIGFVKGEGLLTLAAKTREPRSLMRATYRWAEPSRRWGRG